MFSCIIQTHLRFEASLSLLKLVEHKKHRRLIDMRDFERMALVIQDTMFQVRSGLMTEIVDRLQKGLVPNYYIVVLFLTAHEPEVELKNCARTFLMRSVGLAHEKLTEMVRVGDDGDDEEDEEEAASRRQNALVESNLSRLIHLIAHHPDFGKEVDDLNQAEHYFDFFLECVSSNDNIAYLYHCIHKLKMMRDLDGDGEGVYALCDMMGLLIRERSAREGWSIPTYVGKVDFPKELFGHLGNEDGARNLKRVFLPVEYVETRDGKKRKGEGKKRKVKEKEEVEESDEGSEDGYAPRENVPVKRERNVRKTARNKEVGGWSDEESPIKMKSDVSVMDFEESPIQVKKVAKKGGGKTLKQKTLKGFLKEGNSAVK
jgi:sister-chromatid-cohesion protein PDS5